MLLTNNEIDRLLTILKEIYSFGRRSYMQINCSNTIDGKTTSVDLCFNRNRLNVYMKNLKIYVIKDDTGVVCNYSVKTEIVKHKNFFRPVERIVTFIRDNEDGPWTDETRKLIQFLEDKVETIKQKVIEEIRREKAESVTKRELELKEAAKLFV